MPNNEIMSENYIIKQRNENKKRQIRAKAEIQAQTQVLQSNYRTINVSTESDGNKNEQIYNRRTIILNGFNSSGTI